MNMEHYRKGEREAKKDIQIMGLKYAMNLYDLMDQCTGIDPDFKAGYYQTIALEHGIC